MISAHLLDAIVFSAPAQIPSTGIFPVRSEFLISNLEGLTDVNTIRFSSGLDIAWSMFATEMVANVTKHWRASGNRRLGHQIRIHRSLTIDRVPNSAKINGITEIECAETDHLEATCLWIEAEYKYNIVQEAYFDLNELFINATNEALTNGTFQYILERESPGTPLIVGKIDRKAALDPPESQTNSPSLLTGTGTGPIFVLEFGLEDEGELRSPTQTEVEDLMCQTDRFFRERMQTVTGDTTIESYGAFIDWELNTDNTVQPIRVTFLSNSTFATNGEPVPPDTVVDVMKVKQEDIFLYIENYVWATAEDSIFQFTKSVNFTEYTEGGPTLGTLERATCNTTTTSPPTGADGSPTAAPSQLTDETPAPTDVDPESPITAETENPTLAPTTETDATERPTVNPTAQETEPATEQPTKQPTTKPDNGDTERPTKEPTTNPDNGDTEQPTDEPVTNPGNGGTERPTKDPATNPDNGNTEQPTREPTVNPDTGDTERPTREPTVKPDTADTEPPTKQPTAASGGSEGEGPTSPTTSEPKPIESPNGSGPSTTTISPSLVPPSVAPVWTTAPVVLPQPEVTPPSQFKSTGIFPVRPEFLISNLDGLTDESTIRFSSGLDIAWSMFATEICVRGSTFSDAKRVTRRKRNVFFF